MVGTGDIQKKVNKCSLSPGVALVLDTFAEGRAGGKLSRKSKCLMGVSFKRLPGCRKKILRVPLSHDVVIFSFLFIV